MFGWNSAYIESNTACQPQQVSLIGWIFLIFLSNFARLISVGGQLPPGWWLSEKWVWVEQFQVPYYVFKLRVSHSSLPSLEDKNSPVHHRVKIWRHGFGLLGQGRFWCFWDFYCFCFYSSFHRNRAQDSNHYFPSLDLQPPTFFDSCYCFWWEVNFHFGWHAGCFVDMYYVWV